MLKIEITKAQPELDFGGGAITSVGEFGLFRDTFGEGSLFSGSPGIE